MRIAVLGGTGVTGSHVTKLALSEGHQVVVLTSDSSRVALRDSNLTVVEGSAASPEDVRKAIRGADAVIHCLGIGGKGDGRLTTVVSNSVRAVVAEMQRGDVKRIVCMSNVGAGESGSWFYRRIVLPLFLRWLRPIIADKNVMEAILRHSSREWVSVRLPNIVSGPERPVRTSLSGRGLGFTITAASAARFLLDQVRGDEWLGRSPSISN